MRILSASGAARPLSPADCRSDRSKGRSFRAVGGGVRGAARRDQPDLSALARCALDLDATAKQREPLADAEQPPTDLRRPSIDRRVRPVRIRFPRSVHGDRQLVFGVERQLEGDPLRAGVLDRVEEELSDRLEEQRANVLPFGIGPRIGSDVDFDLVLVVRPVGQPLQCCREARTAAAREETARSSMNAPRRSLRRAGASLRRPARSARRRRRFRASAAARDSTRR